MDAKLTFLLTFLALSLFVTLMLLLLAKRGRNLRRFGDRQLFWQDLHRFIVLILTASAMYLVGLAGLPAHGLAFLPDPALLFATTALPMFLLCLISGRWYLGYAAMLCVQGFILRQGQAFYPLLWHGTLSHLLLQNALCDAGGLLLYGVTTTMRKKSQRQMEQQKHLARFLKGQKALSTK